MTLNTPLRLSSLPLKPVFLEASKTRGLVTGGIVTNYAVTGQVTLFFLGGVCFFSFVWSPVVERGLMCPLVPGTKKKPEQ